MELNIFEDFRSVVLGKVLVKDFIDFCCDFGVRCGDAAVGKDLLIFIHDDYYLSLGY